MQLIGWRAVRSKSLSMANQALASSSRTLGAYGRKGSLRLMTVSRRVLVSLVRGSPRTLRRPRPRSPYSLPPSNQPMIWPSAISLAAVAATWPLAPGA
jgi:hypothetical protein